MILQIIIFRPVPVTNTKDTCWNMNESLFRFVRSTTEFNQFFLKIIIKEMAQKHLNMGT